MTNTLALTVLVVAAAVVTCKLVTLARSRQQQDTAGTVLSIDELDLALAAELLIARAASLRAAYISLAHTGP